MKERYHQQQHTGRIEWKALDRIQIKDLELFRPNPGVFLDGTLVTDPSVAMIGCTTRLEDDDGQVIFVAFYNILPDGVKGEERSALACEIISKGSRIRIAEPFYKIFQDGTRGIRVDNPFELKVISSAGKYSVDLEEKKASGNALFADKSFDGAIEMYLTGLKMDDLTATLLSNRSQTHLELGDYALALADASASLTMRPENLKTWARYETAKAALRKTYCTQSWNPHSSTLSTVRP